MWFVPRLHSKDEWSPASMLCLWVIPVFTWNRNMNVLFSANYNVASLQRISGVNARTERSMKGKLRQSTWVPDDVLQLNGQDVPFVNDIMYLGVTFDRRMAWRHHIKRTVAKALGTYIRTNSLSKSGCLSTNIQYMLYKSLIRSFMMYACPTWEYAVDAQVLKLQCLQNRALCTIENVDRCTPAQKLHVAFKINFVYDYITKLCRTQARYWTTKSHAWEV
jgi:hypothetical protein